MNEKDIELYSQRYGAVIEDLVVVVADLVARRDIMGIEWLVKAIGVTFAVGGAHLRGKDLMN